MKNRITSIAVAAALCCASGCTSLVSTSSSEVAGIGGAAIADAVTTNATAATAIGLGVQSATRTGLQASQRAIHRLTQQVIAEAAGPLKVGQVAHWETRHRVPLEHNEKGRVTVSRVISTSGLTCKETVFSVDAIVDKAPQSSFYVAIVCQEGKRWKWASAEPSTERWGSLQ